MTRPSAADLAGYRNLATGILAVFAAGAGVAQVQDAAPAVRLAFAGVALVGAIAALVLLWIERRVRRFDAVRTATAVGLMLLRDRDGTSLVVTNNGRYVVRDIRTSAFPAGEGVKVPDLHPSDNPQVKTAPMAGGWFSATVTQLSPREGLPIARYNEDPVDFQLMSIEVQWNDHEGEQRKRYFMGNLRDVTVELAMEVGEAPTHEFRLTHPRR